MSTAPQSSASRLAWAVLIVPVVALLIAAVADDRRGWPDLLPGEATVLMQAESLGHDGDLRYTRLDFDRHFLTRPAMPSDLELASGSAGRSITFDHPVLHGAILAPFVRWRPAGGHSLAHGLLLAVVSVWVARRLESRLGFLGPLAVAAVVFGSVAFAHVFLATAGLWTFLAALAAAGLLIEPEASDVVADSRGGERRWLGAGALLSMAVLVDPLHLVLVVAAWLVAPSLVRWHRRAALVFGLLGGLVAQTVLFWLAGGGLGLVATERFRFRPETGFPLVDFPSTEWSEQLRILSAVYFDGAPRLHWGFDLALWGWNSLDLWIGQHAGLLIYALPVLVLWWLASRQGRWAWAVAFGLWFLGLIILHPFDLADGPTIGNARFLPLTAFVLVALAAGEPRVGRFSRPSRVALGAVVVVALSAVGLGGLWTWLSPTAERYPIAVGEGLRYPTALASDWMPYESAQQTLPGGPVLEHGGLRVRPLSAHVEASPGDALTMDGDQTVELWVSSLDPLDTLRLDFGEDAPSTLDVDGATLGDRLLTADGGIAFRLEPTAGRRHVLWWSPWRQSVYRLTFHFPGGPAERLRFRIHGERLSDEADS